MLQKITISIILFVSLFVKLNAQTWTFAGAAGSANAENTKAICTDAAGNVYLTGSFSNTVDFDFGAGTANLTSNGSNDIFIASYTSAGAYRWAVRAGGTGNDNGAPSGGICTDGTNIYVTGAYSGAATSFGATSLTPNGGTGTDAFVAKLNASTGAWTWAVTLGGTGNVDSGVALCIDPSGNPYVLGSFNGTLSGSCANVSNGGSDLFVSKLNPSTGACVWTSSGGSTGNDGTVGGGICYDPTSTELIIGSNFTTGTATYGSFSVPLVGGIDMCVLELNSSTGAWLSAVGCGSATNDDAVGCALDPVTGDVMVCGALTGNLTLPGGISLTASSAGFQDAWVGRYSISSNGFTWAKSATGTANDRAHAIAVDGTGVTVIVGQYLSNPTVFGSQSLTNTNSGGFDEAFVVAYSTSTGTELWSTKNTNTGTQNTATNAKSISYAGSNNYWIAGQNVQGTTFGSTVLNSNGFNDFYIAKYNAPVTCSNPTIGTQPTNKSVCFNGNTSFSIAATGASSYQWQVNTGSGFTNITNGGVYSGATTATLSLTGVNFPSGYLYRCIASSGACQTTSNSATLTVSAYFNTSSQTNVSCNGGSNGSATLNATGGIAPYNYSWSPSGGTGATASGLSAGNYTVTVTDAISCSTTRTYTITQPSALITTTAVTNISCNGGSNGSASITASGGISPYTYLWSSAQTTSVISGQTAGVRTVTVTDANGCTSSKSTNITQPATALSASNVVTNISCFGGSNGAINLTATGGTTAYTFNWGGGITTEDRTGLIAGAYTCTITDANGCTTTSNATVTQPASALATSTAVTNVFCNGGSNGSATITASGGTSPYTYLWSSAQTTSVISGQTAGVRTVTVTDANGCTSSKSISITQPASALSASNVVTNISCFGGSNGAINLTPTGGTTAYSFNWGGGITTEDRTGLLAGAYTCTITDANGCTTTSNATVTQPTSALSASNVVTNISCFGGSNGAINLTPAGGTTAYTFLWSTGHTTEDRTGLLAGAYTCTITDANGCTTTSNATITQPASALSASNVVTNISCFGGSNGAINLTPTGGTTAYTFNWGAGITTEDRTGLLAGAYTCTITDANGCTTTSNATVTQPSSAIATSTAVTNVSCNGGSNGSATITASGGTSPYTYLWSSAQTTSVITGQIAGVRTVTVTDANGCTSSKSISITQPATALSASNVVTNVSCFGGSNGVINLTPTGGTTAYTFNWGGGITTEDRTGLLAGTYTCTITDANGCTTTSNATVTQPASAIAATITSTNTACLSNTGIASVSASGGTPIYTYSWSPSGGTAATASSLGVGTYSCVIKDANLCSITKTINITTSGAPTATIIAQTNVTCNSLCNGSATVSDSGGTTPYNYIWSNGNTTTTATNLCAGVITCTVTGSNGCSTVLNTTITQPTILSANATASAILCNGGVSTVTVSATGGTSSYTGVGTFTTLAGTKSYTVTDANGCSTTTSISISHPSVLSANSSASSILCTGGVSTITVTATGGTPSYSGVGTFTTLTGTKTYTVTDSNGCSTTTSISVTQPSILSANATASAILCNGGVSTMTVTATGGTASYFGTGTFTANTGTQTYTVTDSNGCSATTSVSISEPSMLTANVTASSILCNGGVSTITVTATGGTSSYTGVGTFTTNAGTQTYTVTDANGCSTTTSVSISDPIALTSSQSFTLCAGQSITVGTSTYNASGTYTNVLSAINGCDSTITTNLIVNPAIISSQTVTLCAGQNLTVGSNTYTSTGIYTNTFTAVNGCDSTLTTNLTINSAIVSSQTVTLCAGQSLTVGSNTYTATGIYTNTFTAISGCDSTVTTNLTVNNVIDITTSLNGLTISANESSATYQWIDCDNANQPIASETNQNFTASSNGNYAVIVTQNSCSDTSACVNISTVGIKEVNSLTGIKLYPNPTNSSFTISGVELNTTIAIYNAIGKLVKSIQSSDNNTTIELSEYSNGIYFIKIKNNKGESIQKLIKQ